MNAEPGCAKNAFQKSLFHQQYALKFVVQFVERAGGNAVILTNR